MIPTIAFARIQRWALTLSIYEYTIRFKSGTTNTNADALSRLPLPDTPAETPQPSELVLLMEHLSTGPITAVQIKTMTRKDPILFRVYIKTHGSESRGQEEAGLRDERVSYLQVAPL